MAKKKAVRHQPGKLSKSNKPFKKGGGHASKRSTKRAAGPGRVEGSSVSAPSAAAIFGGSQTAGAGLVSAAVRDRARQQRRRAALDAGKAKKSSAVSQAPRLCAVVPLSSFTAAGGDARSVAQSLVSAAVAGEKQAECV